jgi:hypothetical protein
LYVRYYMPGVPGRGGSRCRNSQNFWKIRALENLLCEVSEKKNLLCEVSEKSIFENVCLGALGGLLARRDLG